jgi:glycosyltransferase involved in cell wall biosynthesis
MEQPDSICTVIPQPFTTEKQFDMIDSPKKEQILKKMGISNKFPIVTSFGYISAHKRYDMILSVFKNILEIYPNAVFIIVGQDNIGLSNIIHELELDKHVVITGFIHEDNLVEILTISDFCINLRYPTAGETSRSVLQIMSYGKPVVVSNVGWFSELPNKSCLKLEMDSYQNTVLLDFFKLLTNEKTIRDSIGKNARDYVKKYHDPSFAAKMYYQFIKDILNGDEIIINSISRSFVDLGLKDINNDSIKSQIVKIKDML